MIEWNGIWMLEGDARFTNEQIIRAGRLDWDATYRNTPKIAELGPGETVIDVGAYIGDSTKFFEDRGCRVFAFEPQADAYECLVKNCPKSTCLNQAVGNGNIVTLHPQEAGNLGARRVYDAGVAAPPGRKMMAVPLDSLFPRFIDRVDCLKIDVEGFEPYVLEGAQKLIAACHPKIIVEFNPGGLAMHGLNPQHIVEQLAGYRFVEIFRYSEQNWDILAI